MTSRLSCQSSRSAAVDRLMLSKRQSQQLQRKLWSSLTDTINKGLEPLSVEHR